MFNRQAGTVGTKVKEGENPLVYEYTIPYLSVD